MLQASQKLEPAIELLVRVTTSANRAKGWIPIPYNLIKGLKGLTWLALLKKARQLKQQRAP